MRFDFVTIAATSGRANGVRGRVAAKAYRKAANSDRDEISEVDSDNSKHSKLIM